VSLNSSVATAPAMASRPDVTPAKILETASAFWPAKVLLTAVELNVFTTLGARAMSAPELQRVLGLHPRGIYDFFDTLVALGFLERDGDGPAGRYRNTAGTARYLDRNHPEYMGGMLEMLNARLFGYWNHLGEALKTGRPQNEVKHSERPLFETLYSDPARLEQFMSAMRGISAPNFQALADKVVF
jgi:hypothetical protein